jgi:hypothetical protein
VLNLADFSMLLMTVIGPLSAFGAAHGHKAGLGAAVLFGLGGLGLGLSVGVTANKCAYRVLGSKKLNGGLAFLVYAAIPFIGILVVALVPFLVAEVIYGHP